MNDGEASAWQQVLKSLILLVGLMKDDDAPGGFVFIDEPFAHLDVRNIQLVGYFLKSTRAQYLLTHADHTQRRGSSSRRRSRWSRAKKPRGERWRPDRGAGATAGEVGLRPIHRPSIPRAAPCAAFLRVCGVCLHQRADFRTDFRRQDWALTPVAMMGGGPRLGAVYLVEGFQRWMRKQALARQRPVPRRG